MIVVDTSVLVNLFRGIQTKSTETLKYFEDHDTPFSIPALCCQELLQGAKDKQDWDRLVTYLKDQEILYPDSAFETYQSAARIFYDLRRKGITVRSTIDCVIAQQVIEIKGAKLLHDDRDFTVIAKNTTLKIFQQLNGTTDKLD